MTRPSAMIERPGAAAPLRRANPIYRAQRSCAATRHSWACMPRSSGIGGSSAWQRCPLSTPSTAVRRSPASASSGQTRSIGPSIATAPLPESNEAVKMKYPGDDLFSQEVAPRVSSALESLTSVFGMGTGGASPLASPGHVFNSRPAPEGASKVEASNHRGLADQCRLPNAIQQRASRVN